MFSKIRRNPVKLVFQRLSAKNILLLSVNHRIQNLPFIGKISWNHSLIIYIIYAQWGKVVNNTIIIFIDNFSVKPTFLLKKLISRIFSFLRDHISLFPHCESVIRKRISLKKGIWRIFSVIANSFTWEEVTFEVKIANIYNYRNKKIEILHICNFFRQFFFSKYPWNSFFTYQFKELSCTVSAHDITNKSWTFRKLMA